MFPNLYIPKLRSPDVTDALCQGNLVFFFPPITLSPTLIS